MTIWKLVLIACIAGLAAAVVTIGHTEEASIVATKTAAPQTTPKLCPAANRPMSRPVSAYRSRYLRQTPVSYTARRNG